MLSALFKDDLLKLTAVAYGVIRKRVYALRNGKGRNACVVDSSCTDNVNVVGNSVSTCFSSGIKLKVLDARGGVGVDKRTVTGLVNNLVRCLCLYLVNRDVLKTVTGVECTCAYRCNGVGNIDLNHRINVIEAVLKNSRNGKTVIFCGNVYYGNDLDVIALRDGVGFTVCVKLEDHT